MLKNLFELSSVVNKSWHVSKSCSLVDLEGLVAFLENEGKLSNQPDEDEPSASDFSEGFSEGFEVEPPLPDQEVELPLNKENTLNIGTCISQFNRVLKSLSKYIV